MHRARDERRSRTVARIEKISSINSTYAAEKLYRTISEGFYDISRVEKNLCTHVDLPCIPFRSVEKCEDITQLSSLPPNA